MSCVDQDGAKIAGLQRRAMPIYEPGLVGLAAGARIHAFDPEGMNEVKKLMPPGASGAARIAGGMRGARV